MHVHLLRPGRPPAPHAAQAEPSRVAAVAVAPPPPLAPAAGGLTEGALMLAPAGRRVPLGLSQLGLRERERVDARERLLVPVPVEVRVGML